MLSRIVPLCVFLCLVGCGAPSSELPDGGLTALVIHEVQPQTILPGSWIRVQGSGFADPLIENLEVVLEGNRDSRVIPPVEVQDQLLSFQVDQGLFAVMGGVGAFQGTLEILADYAEGSRQSAKVGVQWSLVRTLEPSMQSLSAVDEIMYLGKQMQIRGNGFLMEGEGQTLLRFSGTFLSDQGEQLSGWSRSCALEAAGRDELQGSLSAECLGIFPGVFTGAVTPVNLHLSGEEVVGQGMGEVSVELGPTFLTGVEPGAASRGQKVTFSGRGFAGGSAVTTVRIEGTFEDRRGEVWELRGPQALEIAPEVLSGDSMRYVLRVEPDGRGGVQGLGAKAGMLRGTATPIVYHETGMQEGLPLENVSFQVLPQKQLVFIKYLPGFTDALRDFGLRNVEHLIRERILEVCNRDYAGINLEFVAMRPTEYVEYAVIEVGGRDPNGRDLIGLDNTMGKDIGNLYFDDVVGGWNADSAESGTSAFGGVFVSSYLGFSEKVANPMPLASPLFDEIFGPFMPDFGGEPVQASEYPDGPRARQVELAIHALGSMIGNTVTHEIGHTLGLAAGPADVFHNVVPADNQIMDAGIYREFEERAELNGKGPAVWSPENRAYLEHILPE